MIDRLVYKSVPKAVLLARGEIVDEATRGDIFIGEYVDIDRVIIVSERDSVSHLNLLLKLMLMLVPMQPGSVLMEA